MTITKNFHVNTLVSLGHERVSFAKLAQYSSTVTKMHVSTNLCLPHAPGLSHETALTVTPGAEPHA